MSALEQPKKPAGGAFGQFLAEKRAEFTKACEGQKITAVTKMASEAYKKLTDEEKKLYQEKYEAAKAKFEKDMAAFLEAGGVKAKGAAALRSEKRKAKDEKKKKNKDPNAPKKPAGGAYGCFVAEKRPEFQKACAGQSIAAVSKMASEEWKKLSEEEKKPYETTYAAKMEEYKTAQAEYVKNNPPSPAKTAGKAQDGDDTPPAKKRRQPNLTPPAAGTAKRARAAKTPRQSKGKASTPTLELDQAIVDEATTLSLVGALRNLAGRAEIIEKEIPAAKLLAALKNNEGLVNKAKAALLA